MGGMLARLLPRSAAEANIQKGFLYWIRVWVLYIYLIIRRRLKPRRTDLYDFSLKATNKKNGFFVPQKEWELDTPEKNSTALGKHDDSAFIFGVNLNSEALAVNVSRQPDGQVHCSLFLRLSNGEEYSLPEEHFLQKDSLEDFTFGSSRLKLKCIEPLRKWRIFFNGMLKQHDTSEKSAIYRHARFTFIFTVSSDIFDFTSDMSDILLAQDITSSSNLNIYPISTAKKLRHVLDQYEQSGMLLGTLQMEGEEEREIYMWGSRGRYMGETRNLKTGKFLDVYGTFENGSILHLGILNLPDVIPKLYYGYLMSSNAFLHPIESVTELLNSKDELAFNIFCKGADRQVNISCLGEGKTFGKAFDENSVIQYTKLTMDGFKGSGFLFNGNIKKPQRRKISFSLMHNIMHQEVPMIVSFEHSACRNPSLTGGKGSSLGKLYTLSLRHKKNPTLVHLAPFDVPKGIVVTTEAYKMFIKGNLEDNLSKFQKAIWAESNIDKKVLCQIIVDKVTETFMPIEIRNSIKKNLEKVFGDNFQREKFAIRSSATGEDTEQMSAAGQMETFLGLSDIDEILHAVKRCWASQFTFQAVQYKRRYGQLLNTPMAVVIQKMVPCEVAGVAFTCDPVSGNPSYINITANWGLGESVVSASAEPDTVSLKRDINNKLSFHNQLLGKKKTKIIMTNDGGGTEVMELDENQSSNCCLTQDMALKLGEILIKIEEKFGSPRDVEWGIVDDVVYLFQSRAVTSLDIDTDFESIHFRDTYLRSNEEYLTKANVGEVAPNATSPLGIEMIAKTFFLMTTSFFVRLDGKVLPDLPYFEKNIIYYSNHMFMPMIGGYIGPDLKTDLDKSMMISVFGRLIEDKRLVEISTERHADKESPGFLGALYLLFVMFTSGFLNRKLYSKLKSFEVPRTSKDALVILNSVSSNVYVVSHALASHIDCSVSSSLWNNLLITLIEKAKGDWSNDVYSDFGYLLSTCKQVESADVPSAIQSLALAISNHEDAAAFKAMPVEEASKLLQNSKSEAGLQFDRFFKRHGHRCLKEFDVYSTPWQDNPNDLVQILQNMVGAGVKEKEIKQTPSFLTIISKMNVKLGLVSRFMLWCLLPNCRRGVREREFAKSLVIRIMNEMRKVFKYLAKILVEEGYLPDKDLLFFLSVDEIKQLIMYRSPLLVARAIKRHKFKEELDRLIFPEISIGIPKPINPVDNYDATPEEFAMTGIPVSRGIVKAKARVVTNISEAPSIQQGEVLIAYSTDIAWSPYFPLLSGVVTELGGLLSHGAVVAREYGLPCVVGLHGATQIFKSGDTVVLDGNKGIIKRLKQE